MANATTERAAVPTAYPDLCSRLFWPRPIRDEADYRNATEVVDLLAVLPDRNADQEDYLEALSTFVERYDRDAGADEPVGSGVETLRFLMDGRDMSATDLSALLGDSSAADAVLGGRRLLTAAERATVAGHFKVDPSLFL